MRPFVLIALLFSPVAFSADVFASPPSSPASDDVVLTGSPAALAGENRVADEYRLERYKDFAAIKAQYRILVKKHHPDLHGGDREIEEKFKDINQAFATLRRIYEGEGNNYGSNST